MSEKMSNTPNLDRINAIKAAEIDRLRAENERLRRHLAAAGCTLTTASMVIKRLGSEADAALITTVADQVAEALNADA